MHVDIGTHSAREGVDHFGRTGRRPAWCRPLLYILYTSTHTLRFQGCEMHHARGQIEEQGPPAIGKVNDSCSATTVCCTYLTNDPAVRTGGRDSGSSDSAFLSTRSSGVDPLDSSKPLSQSLSSDPLPASRHLPFRRGFTTAKLPVKKSGTSETRSLTAVNEHQFFTTHDARDV